jgi:thiol:disulfide interchange protein DsbD
MLDFYADWCVSCKEMERYTFSDPGVQSRLAGMVKIQADVTVGTADHQALLRRFKLFGPPGIVFFDPAGREIQGLRVIGFQAADKFITVLDQALGVR